MTAQPNIQTHLLFKVYPVILVSYPQLLQLPTCSLHNKCHLSPCLSQAQIMDVLCLLNKQPLQLLDIPSYRLMFHINLKRCTGITSQIPL